MKRQYNKTARELIELNIGENVSIEPYGVHKKWQPGQILDKLPFRRYEIEMNSGRRLIRNRKQIRSRTLNISGDDEIPIFNNFVPIPDETRTEDAVVENDRTIQPEMDEVQTDGDQRPQRTHRPPDRFGDWVYS